MSNFICPICGEGLSANSKSLSCENSHSFDLAKSGYVNLLMSQQTKAKKHGDDKLMVRARSAFLDKGYYQPLLDGILKAMTAYAGAGCRILDAGCGECWYTSHIYEDLSGRQLRPQMLAIDISKDALATGAKRNQGLEFAVASVFHMPVKDNSCDVILSLFAPFCGEEFRRVLKDNGVVIRVIPLEKHLYRLKAAIYDCVYENKIENVEFEGLELLHRQDIRGAVTLNCNEDILSVFSMTPYYYKTGAADQEKLKKLSKLDTEIEFGLFTYRKKK